MNYQSVQQIIGRNSLLPDDFDAIEYQNLNIDLNGLSYDQLIDHYLKYGINEKRVYRFISKSYDKELPEDFDSDEYRILNVDLRNLNKDQLIGHYLNYGIDEKRRYSLKLPHDFNRGEYIEIHKLDINTTLKDCKKHFFNSGTKIYKLNSNYGSLLDINKINKISISKVYILCNNNEGGTGKYIQDIIATFKCLTFISIVSSEELHKVNFKDNDIVLIQQLMGTDISYNDIKFVKENFKCKIILCVHDFCWFHDKIVNSFDMHPYNWHGMYLENNLKISKDIIDLFKLCNMIIHPSFFTYRMYSKYFDNSNFYITDHIDIKIEENINSPLIMDEINIGVFHQLSEYKGSEAILYLMNKYKTYNGFKVNFKISGNNIEKYSEDNFFDQIEKHKIHGMTLLNKWGETYCYTLTKYLNAGLPILYNNFGSFKKRIPRKDSYFRVALNEKEYTDMGLLESKFIEFLEYIIGNSKKENYSFTKSNIVVPKIYKTIFLKSIMEKNIVVITSKIKVSSNVFSYTNNRSIYTTSERYSQTLDTIKSIKKNIPNCYIILFDNSELDEAKRIKLSDETDQFINITDDKVLNDITDNCIYKGIAELYQLLTLYNVFLKNIDMNVIGKNFFKISGRYQINDTFDYNKYDNNNENIFKRDENLKTMQYYFTCFYKLDSKYINEFFKRLQVVYDNKEKYQEKNMEEFIPEIIDYNFKKTNHLGVTQKIAVWNEVNDI